MLQDKPAPRLDVQLVVCAKTAGLAPPRAMPVMASGALPVLERVAVCAVVVVPAVVAAKVIPVVGVSEAWGTRAAVPVPERAMAWGEPVALSEILMVAGKEPAVCGLKTTDKEQDADVARLAPQVLVRA